MRRRAASALLLVLAALAAPARASSGPIEDGRDALEELAFVAEVTLRWSDARGWHETELDVEVDHGRVHIEGPGTVAATGDERLVLRGSQWQHVWPATAALPRVAPAAADSKYVMHREPGPTVAGRLTEIVELHAGGMPRERLAVDRDTGLILHREVLDSLGRTVRVMTVERLVFAPAGGERRAPAVSLGGDSHAVVLEPPPRAYRMPATLAGGYDVVGSYLRGGVVHVLYSDGLHTVSVFAQPGRLNRGSLPGGGRTVPLQGGTAVVYSWPGGDAVAWGARGMVYVVVGDGAREDMLTAARSLPMPSRPSFGDRVRQAARSVAELIGASS